jgi:hypothetical protein
MNLDWVKYSEVADRFQYKARFEDREDLRHNIILRLAEVASNNGHKPFTIGAMIRVASYVVMEYWHSEKRNGKVISLNTDIGNGDGDSMELMDTIADDSALDLESWVDARTWLLGCPKRLIQIANKRVSGIALEPSDKMYLGRFRRKEQKPLASVTF